MSCDTSLSRSPGSGLSRTEILIARRLHEAKPAPVLRARNLPGLQAAEAFRHSLEMSVWNSSVQAVAAGLKEARVGFARCEVRWLALVSSGPEVR